MPRRFSVRSSSRSISLGIIAAVVSGSVATPTVFAQTNYSWIGGASGDWLNSANWSPTGAPGIVGTTGNIDRAFFDGAAGTASAINMNTGFNLGAIIASGGVGGTGTAAFSGNSAFVVHGNYSVDGFNNVVVSAEGAKDLAVTLTNMNFDFGSPPTTPNVFYAGAGRKAVITAQSIQNLGGTVSKEGAGTVLWSGESHLNNATLNINHGTLGGRLHLNEAPTINVATGAALQAGLAPLDTWSTGGVIHWADHAQLKIVTDGTNVSTLLNAPGEKGVDDIFDIVLTGFNPAGGQTFNPTGFVYISTLLTGFDPNGFYNPSAPGHFNVLGDGFFVSDWGVEVLNANQIRLAFFSVGIVPEPGTWMMIGAAAVAGFGWRRWRRGFAMIGVNTNR